MSNRIQIFNLRAQLFDLSFCVGGVFFVATKPAQLERIVYESVKSHTVCGDCAFVVVDLTLFSSVLTVYANEGPLLAVDLEVVKMLRLLKLIQPFLCHCRIRFDQNCATLETCNRTSFITFTARINDWLSVRTMITQVIAIVITCSTMLHLL